MKFTVSEKAAQKLCSRGAYFRVRVDTGGCFGFQYAFSFEDNPATDDLLIKDKGAKILIDTVSQAFLEGATLEYQDEMIGSTFCIENPKAENACGCKNSFSFNPSAGTTEASKPQET